MTRVRVGLFPPNGVARVAEEGVDNICVGDYRSFFVGRARTG